MKKFDFNKRAQNLSHLEENIFDVLIIGGGINGAGIARDAASRGMKVALIEANDFASGTSSRSSKLIHGGIRYLENLEFKLVFEALSERSLMFEIAPHLVHQLKFMIPLFKSSRIGMFKMGIGMWLYDILSLFQTPEIHQKLNKQQTQDLQPEIKNEDLLGSFIYCDAYMDDDLLVFETLRSANDQDATIVNYVEAKKYSFENQLHTIQAIDSLTQNSLTIRAHQMISCVGPWTDSFGLITDVNWKQMLRPTKGIHLILPRSKMDLHQAVVMGAETGKRIIFAIPRGDFVIIGTTDTDFNESPDFVHSDNTDVEYLLQIVNSYFPKCKISKEDILSSYAGVRPLVKDDSESTGKTSREHVIKKGKNEILYVAGGKYTTYRKIAEEAVDKLVDSLSIEKRVSFGRSNTKIPINPRVTQESYKNYLDQKKGKNDYILAEKFGVEADDIIKRYSDFSTVQKMVAFHIENTMCLSIADYYLRRSHLVLTHRDHGLSLFDEIAEVFKKQLLVDEKSIKKEYEKIQNHIKLEMSWKKNIM